MESEAGELSDAVGDVEGEGVGALVRHGLDVVQPALVDHRLVKDCDLQFISQFRKRIRAKVTSNAGFYQGWFTIL